MEQKNLLHFFEIKSFTHRRSNQRAQHCLACKIGQVASLSTALRFLNFFHTQNEMDYISP
jgi:hypothetical protein